MKAITLSASGPKQELLKTEVELGPLKPDEVLIQVESCGVCHSDLSMLNNDWGFTPYPFVPGHEVAGRIVELGSEVRGRKLKDRVGLGWYSRTCMCCSSCLSGDQNLCANSEPTMIGRPGGFASHVKAHWAWTTLLPDAIKSQSAGPFFCGGITVFNPIIQNNVLPTDRVGVVGIGGLGHIALQFLNKWGCEVTAFTSSPKKADEAKRFGAHEAITSTDEAALKKVAGKFNYLIVTANASLPWQLYIDALAPRGKMHFVGAVPEPIPVTVFPLLVGQKSISGSPVGSPAVVERMLDFASRHKVEPQIEVFKMSDVNKAMRHLEEGKARYRIVLDADLS